MAESLEKVAYFADFTADEFKLLADIMQEKSYQQNEIIFFQGEAGDALYLIKAGKVKLVKMMESGDEQILNILQAGSIFAEVVLFDKAEYPATAIALEDTTVGFLKREAMEELIKKKPTIGLKIMKVMSKRLRRAQKMVKELGLKDTKRRTASILIYLAEEHAEVEKNVDLELGISVTQQDLANMIGTSRETVSRILNQFKSDDLIAIARQKIIIKNLAKLKERA